MFDVSLDKMTTTVNIFKNITFELTTFVELDCWTFEEPFICDSTMRVWVHMNGIIAPFHEKIIVLIIVVKIVLIIFLQYYVFRFGFTPWIFIDVFWHTWLQLPPEFWPLTANMKELFVVELAANPRHAAWAVTSSALF